MRIADLTLKNNIFLAPMAGITNLPYRLLMKKYGPALVFTEMVSACGLVYSGSRTKELLRSDSDEKPLAIQLFGEDPEILEKATKLIEHEGSLIDLNLGCPVNKVVRNGAGSALLRDPLKIGRIVAKIRKATKKPFTIKLRSGWDQQSINFLEVAKIAESEGVDAITLHPRPRSQFFGGTADWEQIANLKADMSIPVIGSGDLFTAEDVIRMLAQTGCDAVMVGRGAYGNPWIIQNALRLQAGKSVVEPDLMKRKQAIRQHIALYLQYFPEQKAIRDMRKHLCWYTRGLPGAAVLRTRVNKSESLQSTQALLDDYFSVVEDTLHEITRSATLETDE